MTAYVDWHDHAVVLGARLGEGGEARVYALANATALAAKVYLRPPDALKRRKLETMVAHRPCVMRAHTAWPISLLLTSGSREVAGFVMPQIRAHPAHELYGPLPRMQHFPAADWRFLVWAARNLAALVDSLHVAGYVIGDINETNVCFDEQGNACLIDCDSLQFSRDGLEFTCGVGSPLFTPPELQGASFESALRTPQHDRFGLAVLVFQLLMMGRHPYMGVLDTPDAAGPAELIRAHRYAYGVDATSRGITPPPDAPQVEIVGPPIVELFARAFDPACVQGTPRPTAQEWHAALTELLTQLVSCADADKGHVHARHVECPWCQLACHQGVDYFLATTLRRRIADGAVDPEAILREALELRLPSRMAPHGFPMPRRNSVLVAPWPARLLRGVASAAWRLGFVAGIFRLFQAPWCGTISLALFTTWIVAGIGRSRITVVRAARARYTAASKCWDDEWHAYDEARTRLDETFALHRHRSRELQASCNALAGGRARAHAPRRAPVAAEAESFLGQQKLTADCVTGIGPRLLAALRAQGIETARDLTPEKLACVASIGPARQVRLLAWRQQLLERFRSEAPHRWARTRRTDPPLSAIAIQLAEAEQRAMGLRAALRRTIDAAAQLDRRARPGLDRAAEVLSVARADREALA